jgi:hypothetical protein
MNNVNNNFIYYQVPININNNQTDLELFIAKQIKIVKLTQKKINIY